MSFSLSSVKLHKSYCKYCKRNLFSDVLSLQSQVCLECEEILKNPQNICINLTDDDFRKENRFLILKTIILGGASSNKTELFRNYIHNFLSHSYQPTIGLDIAGKDIFTNNRYVRITISIISYLKRFKIIRREFYSGTNIAFLVCDTTSLESLKELEEIWDKDLKDYRSKFGNKPNLQKVLIGNKWEFVNQRVISKEGFELFAEKLGLNAYFLCDSTGRVMESNTSTNIYDLGDAFNVVASHYLENNITQTQQPMT